MLLRLSLFFFVVALGCGSQAPYVVSQAPGEPVLAHPAPASAPDPASDEARAWTLLQRRDYVRALRWTYRAAQTAPEAPRPAFLAALIYDQGFDRPDLALIEYNRLLRLAARNEALIPLRPRLYHLYRVAQQRAAVAALKPGHPAPLSGAPLAVFPLRPWHQTPSDRLTALAVSDLLLFDLQPILGADRLDPLQIHLVGRVYQNAFPNATPAAFARWVGAASTLSGDIVCQEAHGIVVSLQVHDSTGAVVRRLDPVSGNLNDLGALRRALLTEVTRALNLTLPTTYPLKPIASSLALPLYAQGVNAFLSEDLDSAERWLQGALALSPGAPIIEQWRFWVAQDRLGAQTGSNLIALYQKWAVLPNPRAAAKRRLLATQNLVTPQTGLDGEDPVSPYKPPQPETHP